jgi:PAS domain S-box-containing protein
VIFITLPANFSLISDLVKENPGNLDYISEPFHPDMLLLKINHHLHLIQQRENVEKLNFMLDESSCLIFELDKDLRIKSANKTTRNILGYKRNEIKNMFLPTFLKNPEDEEEFNLRLMEKTGIRKNRNKFISSIIQKDGKEMKLLFSMYKYSNSWICRGEEIDEAEKEKHLLEIFEDLEKSVKEKVMHIQTKNEHLESEMYSRRHVEENLRYSISKLTKINKDLDNLIYAMSHDLKLPVNNIIALVREIKWEMHNGGSDVDMLLSMLDDSSKRLIMTLEDLISNVKATKNSHEQIEDVKCSEVINEICMSIESTIKGSKASISYNFESTDFIRLTKSGLKSILYNLISNAIKYRSPDRPPVINITLTGKENCTSLSVKDNGMGISAEGKSKLFTLFQRFHENVEGSGMGLYILKNILEKFNAKIEVESKEGEGSEFRICFLNNQEVNKLEFEMKDELAGCSCGK